MTNEEPFIGPSTVIAPSAPESRAAEQVAADAGDMADLSEIITTGFDDKGGLLAVPAAPSTTFAFSTSTTVDFAAIKQAYGTTTSFRSHPTANATLNGHVVAQVSPVSTSSASAVDGNYLAVVMTFDLIKTFSNGDLLQLTTEPNLRVLKAGRREGGKITRNLVGFVRRKFTSAADAKANFDLHVNHAGTGVVDAYTQGSFLSRTINGKVGVKTNENFPYDVLLRNLQRQTSASCVCPTSGSVILSFPDAADAPTNYDLAFEGGCGRATIESASSNRYVPTGLVGTVTWDKCNTGSPNEKP